MLAERVVSVVEGDAVARKVAVAVASSFSSVDSAVVVVVAAVAADTAYAVFAAVVDAAS